MAHPSRAAQQGELRVPQTAAGGVARAAGRGAEREERGARVRVRAREWVHWRECGRGGGEGDGEEGVGDVRWLLLGGRGGEEVGRWRSGKNLAGMFA